MRLCDCDPTPTASTTTTLVISQTVKSSQVSKVTCSGAAAELPGWNETGLGFGLRWSAPIAKVDTGYAEMNFKR